MDYKARLDELATKNELTETERAELYHISTLALLQMRDNLTEIKKILEGSELYGSQ